MNNLYDLDKIKKIYNEGGNIIAHLKEKSDTGKATIEDILISYDFQSGSYIKYTEANKEYNTNYTMALANVLNKLGDFNSIMEVGVGEATTLTNLLPKINNQLSNVLGFDISWSRLRYGKQYLKSKKVDDVQLFTSNLFNIALPNNSVDVVYTSHSIEPNGGKEKEALQELYRVASKYLVFLEPSHHFGSQEAKERMERNGYITKLHNTAVELGYDVQEYRLFDYCANELNPTELIVIKKDEGVSGAGELNFMCPISKSNLIKAENEYFSKEGLLVYPVISGIPCLLSDNAIIATKYSDFI